MTSVRLCLLAALLGHSASGCSAFAPSSAGGVVRRSTAPALRMSPSSADDGSDASVVSSRRAFFRDAAASASAASAVLLSSPSASYAAATPPTADELKRIKTGHDGILYLLDNWDKETTVCRENGGECKRDADAVRKYLGLRSTTDPLFQIEKVFNKVKYMDLDPDKLDDFFEAAENWNSAMNMSNSMAFISQFGEYNPGGGKDEVLKYLNEAYKQVVDAEKNLKIIMECLDIA